MLAEYEYVMAVQVHRVNAVTRVDIRVRHPVSLTGHKNRDSRERLAIDTDTAGEFRAGLARGPDGASGPRNRARQPLRSVSLGASRSHEQEFASSIDTGVEPKFSLAPTRVVVYLGQSVMASTLV